MAELGFIVNPASRNGRTRRLWPRLRRTFGERLDVPFDVHVTERPGHATDLARAAIRDGTRTLVAVGGDGTLNEVVNGYLAGDGRPLAPETRIAPLSIGTGSDFVRTYPFPTDPVELARRLGSPATRRVDVGRAMFGGPGASTARFFLNIAEFGSGGAVVDRVNRTAKVLGGRMSFLLAILATMSKYRNTRVGFEPDGGPRQDLVVNDFIVANGRFFGGGLMPAPHADLSDGLLDVVVVGDLDFRTIRKNLPRMRAGTHLDLAGITSLRCRSLAIHAGDEMIDLDGEFVGRTPTSFEVVPGAVRLVA
jgi:YegS/Rv2252/BmrU family lipid kinase